MATGKRGYHHGDLRRALLDAALEALASVPAEDLSLREVSARVGVTHTAAYRHFEDKTSLFAALAEEGYHALGDALDAAATGKRAPRAKLRALASCYVAFALAHPGRHRVMAGPRLNEDGRFPELERAVDAAFGRLQGAIADGQAAGVFRSGKTLDLAITVWVAAHGYVDLVLRRRIKVRSTGVAVAYFESVLEPVLDGLEAP